MMRVALAALLYGLFFGSVELISKQINISKDSSRKLVHIISGSTAACLPLFLSFHEILWLSLLFIPVMIVSKRFNFFSSIHQVKRTTYGEVYFPLAIFLTALLFPHKPIYVYGLLVMALSDGFASVIGQKFGKRTYKIMASRKSYIGSLTFFIITMVLGLLTLYALNVTVLQAVLVSTTLGLILTFGEASLSYGLDNLLLPPAAGFLLWIALKLVLIP